MGLDLSSIYTDSAQHTATAAVRSTVDDLDYLDRDLSDLYDLDRDLSHLEYLDRDLPDVDDLDHNQSRGVNVKCACPPCVISWVEKYRRPPFLSPAPYIFTPATTQVKKV